MHRYKCCSVVATCVSGCGVCAECRAACDGTSTHTMVDMYKVYEWFIVRKGYNWVIGESKTTI
jgi:hypothetical protein